MRKFNSTYFKLLFVSLFISLAFSCSNPSSPSDDGSYEEAKNVLRKLGDKVKIDSTGKDYKGSSVVYFYFTQPVDHNDDSQGTFEQYCVLHYKGKNHISMLQTNGYSIPEKKDYFIEDIGYIFDANYIEVEHRYYKHSDIGLPEPYTGEYWKYNTAAQATADLHDIVTALKGTGDFGEKWISTGLSKDGILTAMYAYKYPNEMDVYVPFGAPFITGQEEPEIGKYLAETCGSQKPDEKEDTTVNMYAWTALTEYLATPKAQEVVYEYARKVDKGKYYDADYTRQAMTYNYVNNLFQKYAYRRWDFWSRFIPLYSNFNNNEEVYAEVFYVFSTTDADNFDKNIEILEKLVPAEDDSSQRSLQISSRAVSTKTHQSPKKVVDAAYYVQAAMELGYYLFDWSLVENVLTGDDLARFNEDLVEIKKWNSNTTYNDDYNVTFDGGALMKGFLHFLENNASNDKCKMVFIYGENDPWTGAAIPDDAADDTYIKKFVIPQGIHNSELNNETYYPKDYRQKIIEAIEGFLY